MGICCLQDPEAITSGATDANAIALPGPPLTSPGFAPSPAFAGAKIGMVFKTGAQGTGYYPDGGLKISAAQAPAVTASTGMLCLESLHWWWAVLPSCCLGRYIRLGLKAKGTTLKVAYNASLPIRQCSSTCFRSSKFEAFSQHFMSSVSGTEVCTEVDSLCCATPSVQQLNHDFGRMLLDLATHLTGHHCCNRYA